MEQFKNIFKDGFMVDDIIKNISLKLPNIEFIPNETLIFFDEMQECESVATSLKAFREDGRYDVVCSGSLMGINYKKIESNSVGNKEDFIMHSMDFEEFLWALGYKEKQIDAMYEKMLSIKPLSEMEYNVMLSHFRDYMVIGGMPRIISKFIENKNFSGILKAQKQIF